MLVGRKAIRMIGHTAILVLKAENFPRQKAIGFDSNHFLGEVSHSLRGNRHAVSSSTQPTTTQPRCFGRQKHGARRHLLPAEHSTKPVAATAVQHHRVCIPIAAFFPFRLHIPPAVFSWLRFFPFWLHIPPAVFSWLRLARSHFACGAV